MRIEARLLKYLRCGISGKWTVYENLVQTVLGSFFGAVAKSSVEILERFRMKLLMTHGLPQTWKDFYIRAIFSCCINTGDHPNALTAELLDEGQSGGCTALRRGG